MAETVNSGSVEPDQARTCEGNKRNTAQKAYFKDAFAVFGSYVSLAFIR
ncbi:hypothetical protein TUM3792_14780 [Shewanella sp. MBTL60-007]|nr:hypothetical protein TUM3792_14780 [Shewanella sp. MBTL60-007]